MKDKTIKFSLQQVRKDYKFIFFMVMLLNLGMVVNDHLHSKEENLLRENIDSIDKRQIEFLEVFRNFGSKIIEKKILTVEEWKDVFDAAIVKPVEKEDAIWIRNRTLK